MQSYLKERGAYETLCSFQLETGLSEGRLGPELLYIQRLVLQGRSEFFGSNDFDDLSFRWDEVNEFLQSSKAKHNLSATV